MRCKTKAAGILAAAVMGIATIFGGVSAAAATASPAKYVVVLDPGHGGIDDGACAVHNGRQYRESDINWKIAQYTKQELEKQKHIEVHLTRTANEAVPIGNRVPTAKKYQPDLLVSQHINSDDSPYPHGASVLISKGTWRPYLHEAEKKFGGYVIEELKKIGITNRYAWDGGMEYRLSGDGSRYPNGGSRDYYAIVAGSVEANFPGVIIEHAFITNYGDAVSYLSTDAQLKKIGQADAKAIIRYVNGLPEKKPKNGWHKENNAYYYYKDNVLQKDKILKINGNIYYVDKNGKRQTGWKTVKGKKYYFKSDGTAHKGWKIEKDGTRYYFNSKEAFMYINAVLQGGNGNRYIFGKDGKLAKPGWTYYKSNYYYTTKYGYVCRGAQEIGGKHYYFDPVKGYRYNNKRITAENGDVYYYDENGVRYEKGFKTLKYGTRSYTYYFQKNGKAKKGWMQLNRKWYYFNSKSGVMYKNATLKTSGTRVYRFDGNGVCKNRFSKKASGF